MTPVVTSTPDDTSPNASNASPMRVLTFDGGPSAVMSLWVLKKLIEKDPGFLELVDLFVGVSDGGFVSLYLADAMSRGVSSLEAIDGCIAFNEALLRTMKSSSWNVARLVLNRSMFGGKRLRSVLEDTFGTRTLGQLKKPAAVAAFNGTAMTMTTYHAFAPGGNPDTLLVDAALASSAFPLLFPLFRDAKDPHRPGHVIIDGGFVDNSATLAALLDTLRYLNPKDPLLAEAQVGSASMLSSITLLSIGALPSERTVFKAVTEWLFPLRLDQTSYAYGWFFLLWNFMRIPLALLDGNAAADNRTLQQLLGLRQYHRFEPQLRVVGLMKYMFVDPERTIREGRAMGEQLWNQSDECFALREWVKNSWYVPLGTAQSGQEPAPRAG